MANPAPQPTLTERLTKLINDMTEDANFIRDKRAATDALIRPYLDEIARLNKSYEEEIHDSSERLHVTRDTFFQLLIENRKLLFTKRKSLKLAGALIKQLPSTVLDITDEGRVVKRLKEIGKTDLIKVVETVRKEGAKNDKTVFQRIRKGWSLRHKLIFNVDLAGEPRPDTVSPDDPFHPSESIYLN